MNAWDRIEEVRKKTESLTKVIKGLKETFTDFLQRLTVKRMIPNSEARQTIIDSLALENANSQCKRLIRPSKVRSTLLEKWIQDTINIESHNCEDSWIGEVISRVLKKNRNVKC